MHHKIFISYSRVDSEFAKRLDHDLDNAGFDSFLDQNDIPPGVPWDDAIQKALGASTTVVVVLSPESVSSGNVLDEIGYALRVGKRVIPVRHKACEIPLRINRLQYADFTSSYDAGLTQLITALKGELATQAIRLDPPPPSAAKQPDPPPTPPSPPPTSSIPWIAILIALAVVGGGLLIWKFAYTGAQQPNAVPPPIVTTVPQRDTSTTSTTTLPSGDTTVSHTTSAADTSDKTKRPPVKADLPHKKTPVSTKSAAFVCDEDKLPACCRDSPNPAECRKCKKKLDIADRCE